MALDGHESMRMVPKWQRSCRHTTLVQFGVETAGWNALDRDGSQQSQPNSTHNPMVHVGNQFTIPSDGIVKGVDVMGGVGLCTQSRDYRVPRTKLNQEPQPIAITLPENTRWSTQEWPLISDRDIFWAG